MQTGSSETLVGYDWILEKTLMFLYGIEWRERGYGLRARRLRGVSFLMGVVGGQNRILSEGLWSDQ